MKTRIAVLALIAAALGVAVPSWAFQSSGVSTVTAGAFVGGQKMAAFTLAIRDAADPFGANRSSITWSNVSAGNSWTIADQLIVLNSTVTDDNGGIQIYTDNTAADASPQFVDPDPTNDPTNKDASAAGLLRGTSGTTSTLPLPMAWSIKSSTKIVEGGVESTGIGATDPNTGSTAGINNKFQWLFVTDASNTAGIDFNGDGDVADSGDSSPFVDGGIFASMVRAGGIHVQQNPASIEGLADGENAYVYMQANFTGASAQQAYQTTALRIEAFIE